MLRALRKLRLFHVPMLLAVGALGWTVGHAAVASLAWPLINDPPIFHYIASRIMAGDAPYRDIYDMNMPGTYLLHMLCMTLLGRADEAFRYFDLAWLAYTGIAMMFFCRWRSWIGGLLAALLFAGMHMGGGAYGAGQRDYFMVLFLVMAAHMAARGAVAGQPDRSFMLSGIWLGMACLIKPYAAIYGLMIWLVLMPLPQLAFDRGRLVRQMLMGGALPAIAVALWLGYVGGLSAFVEMMVQLMGAGYNDLSGIRDFVPGFIAVALASVLMPAAGKGSGQEIRGQLLLAGMVYGWLHYYLQSRGWGYHLYPFWGFAFLTLGYYLPVVLSRRPWLQRMCACVALGVLCYAYSPWQLFDERRFFRYISIADYTEEMEANLKTARAELPPSAAADEKSEKLHFIDFTEAHLWNMAYRLGWIPASRHIYPLPLLLNKDAPYTEQLRGELFSELEEKKPQLLIISRQSSPFHYKFLWELMENDREFLRFLRTHYKLSVEHRLYRIYTRKS